MQNRIFFSNFDHGFNDGNDFFKQELIKLNVDKVFLTLHFNDFSL